ncbi:hypothetical protein [Pueribacillus sp. YX66]|uniref:hypothetical protein n=1 Tax=Pueribacillus sp. YX66 TaxID=3229242 RepID=UPI00358CE650
MEKFDEITKTASEEEKERLKKHFIISSELEYMFFNMPYTGHNWLLQKQVTKV